MYFSTFYIAKQTIITFWKKNLNKLCLFINVVVVDEQCFIAIDERFTREQLSLVSCGLYFL